MNMLGKRGKRDRVVAKFAVGAVIGSFLGGCTIVTHDGRGPNQGSGPQTRSPNTRTPNTRAPNTRTPQTSQGGSETAPAGKKGPWARHPTRPTQPSGSNTSTNTTPAPATAPVITKANIFGSPTKGLYRGLAYVIPVGTTKLPDFNTLVPFATLYTNVFNVAEQEFTGGFPGALVQEEWFAIRYEGTFALSAGGDYTVKLTSDDGAIVYIDGKKVVDNDGVHSTKTASKTLPLSAGKHDLRLDYFQAAKGKVALQLNIDIGK